ncbi:MAG: SDR family NAD(P)-dependent oxidoreductase [Oscillospiraceae bacterium]|nr:SDR family NAD(P)-dependent oxidoreductase [Oscillospiraceae bacterium]MDD6145623.1 SDR family NAD(P)-dependent oxidoreductase [Oscillospiraceae bacterium]
MTKCWYDYKTVIVSGASSGIGKGLVIKLIKDHGCNVIGIARNESKLLALKEELGALAHKFTYRTFDVSLKDKWVEFGKYLEEEKIQPDMLINNAGILPKFDRFVNYTLEDIDKAMQINFYSCVYSMNVLMPVILRSSTPAIVNVASSAALCSLAGTSVYSASKAALKSFTDAVREEHRDECYIGLVCPGFTKTDIFRNQSESTGTAQKAMDMVSTDCQKMVDMIIDGIWKKKEDMIFGVDAHLMDIGNKAVGTLCSNVASKVMKISGLDMFKDIFKK